jgi:hypothetical protein
LSSPPIVQSAVTPPSTSQAIESKKYPIDLPSPILLGSSMTLAIAATGRYHRIKVFQCIWFYNSCSQSWRVDRVSI